jgi:hypothetical protein
MFTSFNLPLLSFFSRLISTHLQNSTTEAKESKAELTVHRKAGGWQSYPSRRGTIDIFQGCVFVIVACTWTVQHLNVPATDDSARAVRFRKAKWAAVAVLFPEFILTHAFLERGAAIQSLRVMEKVSGVCIDDLTLANKIRDYASLFSIRSLRKP